MVLMIVVLRCVLLRVRRGMLRGRGCGRAPLVLYSRRLSRGFVALNGCFIALFGSRGVALLHRGGVYRRIALFRLHGASGFILMHGATGLPCGHDARAAEVTGTGRCGNGRTTVVLARAQAGVGMRQIDLLALFVGCLDVMLVSGGHLRLGGTRLN